jgi:hypothetical protein
MLCEGCETVPEILPAGAIAGNPLPLDAIGASQATSRLPGPITASGALAFGLAPRLHFLVHPTWWGRP